MFTQKYISKKIKQYKFRKNNINGRKLPFTEIKYRKKLHNCLRRALSIKSKLCGLSYEFVNKSDQSQNETVIYAVTHIGKYDFEMLMEAYDGYFVPVAGDWELMYGTVDDYFLRLNGVIYIDTNNKEDRKNTYDAMVNFLNQGIPILIFPEGIWNVTENLPIMKLFPGVVKAANECRIPIVPIGMEQRDKHFYINIGNKMNLTELDEKAAVEKLRDALASLKWQIWEQLPVEKRQNISDDYYETFINSRLAEWSPCTMNLINSRMFKDYKDRELESIRMDLERLKKYKC